MATLRWLALIGAALSILVGTAWYLDHLESSNISISNPPPQWGEGSAVSRNYPIDSMVLTPSGLYTLGSTSPQHPKTLPSIQVPVSSYYLDRYPVTNAQFEQFVTATGYTTTAETEGGGWIYKAGAKDWKFTKKVNWRQPLGPGSSIDTAMDHPVVLVSWFDASAYAKWAGKRLPSEIEWEVAAQSAPDTDPSADASSNVWQGKWPQENKLSDGYFYTSPVGAFSPTPSGLFDLLGNVWEWTADPYDESAYNVSGNSGDNSARRVARGGSWFCSANYCSAYTPSYRGKSPPRSSFNNVGFRCAKSVQD